MDTRRCRVSLLRIAWRQLWTRPLVAALTIASVALGVGLIGATLTARRELERAFAADAALFDLVVGAKGSPLQLVLSSIWLVDVPTGNLPHDILDRLRADPRVVASIPIGLGDSYRGARIVGTERSIFELERRKRTGIERVFRGVAGRLFEHDFEAVVGAEVARRHALRLGDRFVGTHGVVAVRGAAEHDAHPYTVVGVLEPTASFADRAIFVSLPSLWIAHGPAHREETSEPGGEPDERGPDPDHDPGTDRIPEDSEDSASIGASVSQRGDLTSILVQLGSPASRGRVSDDIARETRAMAAIPLAELLRLRERLLDPLGRAFIALAAVVVAVATLTILATLWQSAERQRRDLAVLRMLGARRREIFAIVFLEAAWLTAIGVSLGWLIGRLGLSIGLDALFADLAAAADPWSFDRGEAMALLAVIATGCIAGSIPAFTAYLRSPARDLSED
jgi:putative ABC transport system permease protein